MPTVNIIDQMKYMPLLISTIINNTSDSQTANSAKAPLTVDHIPNSHVLSKVCPPVSDVFTVGKDDNLYNPVMEENFLETLTALRMNSNLLIPYNGHISTVTFKINYDSAETLTYKKVANRIKPVTTMLPEKFCIVHHIPSDPLAKLPIMPTWLPSFTPGVQYTEEQMKAQDINSSGFLTEEEEKLIHHLIHVHENSFAWTEEEKGKFSNDYFDPVVILTVEHMQWVLKNIPIPPGKYNNIIKIIKDKITLGVYEPSNSSYHSHWF